MKTLDEAIKNCKEKAKELKSSLSDFPRECFTQSEIDEIVTQTQEHEQLAEWLKELKALKERPQGDIRWTDKLSVKSNGDIIDFECRVVGHINLEDIKGG